MARKVSSVTGQKATLGRRLSPEWTQLWARARVTAIALAATRMMVA